MSRIYPASSSRNGKYESVIAALRSAGHQIYDWREGDFAWNQIDPDWRKWSPQQYRAALLEHPVAGEVSPELACARMVRHARFDSSVRQRFPHRTRVCGRSWQARDRVDRRGRSARRRRTRFNGVSCTQHRHVDRRTARRALRLRTRRTPHRRGQIIFNAA
jgi:hypothetical protein